jgi:hypothetical protein
MSAADDGSPSKPGWWGRDGVPVAPPSERPDPEFPPEHDLAGRAEAASRALGFTPSNDVEPREVVRDGQVTRIYRRPAEKWVMYLSGLVICVPMTIQLVESVADNSHSAGNNLLLIVLLLALCAAIPTGWFYWTRRLGVYVTDAGVRNVSVNRINFTEWPAINRFVVAQYAPLSSCVFAERSDGSRTALNALSRWTKWQNVLTPYCDALNHELATRRPAA